jgi:hypothetical protein
VGEIISIYCKRCKKTEEYWLGTGFFHSVDALFIGNPPEILDKVKDKIIASEIKNKLNEGAVPGDDYGWDIYYCNKCKTIDQRLYFCFYEKCRFCKTVMKRIDETYENGETIYSPDDFIEKLEKLDIRCKRCGGKEFEIIETGLWD